MVSVSGIWDDVIESENMQLATFFNVEVGDLSDMRIMGKLEKAVSNSGCVRGHRFTALNSLNDNSGW